MFFKEVAKLTGLMQEKLIALFYKKIPNKTKVQNWCHFYHL